MSQQQSVLYDALGPRGQRRVVIGSVLAGVLIIGVVALGIVRLAAKGQFQTTRWEVFTQPAVVRFLANGLLATVKVALTAGLLSLVFGLALALARLSVRRAARYATGAWIEFFRGVPLLLLILFIAHGLPQYGMKLSAYWFLVLGLTIYNSAVLAEIFRAGILSLDRGQREAAYAIGLTYAQSMRLVIVPQAVRRMVPTLVSQLVTLLKDSSLGFVIPFEELLRRGRGLGEFYPQSILQAYVVVAAIYIAVNFSLGRVAVWLEGRQAHRYGGRVHLPGGPEDLAMIEVRSAALVPSD
jgi:glutamate transport system permease protein